MMKSYYVWKWVCIIILLCTLVCAVDEEDQRIQQALVVKQGDGLKSLQKVKMDPIGLAFVMQLSGSLISILIDQVLEISIKYYRRNAFRELMYHVHDSIDVRVTSVSLHLQREKERIDLFAEGINEKATDLLESKLLDEKEDKEFIDYLKHLQNFKMLSEDTLELGEIDSVEDVDPELQKTMTFKAKKILELVKTDLLSAKFGTQLAADNKISSILSTGLSLAHTSTKILTEFKYYIFPFVGLLRSIVSVAGHVRNLIDMESRCDTMVHMYNRAIETLGRDIQYQECRTLISLREIGRIHLNGLGGYSLAAERFKGTEYQDDWEALENLFIEYLDGLIGDVNQDCEEFFDLEDLSSRCSIDVIVGDRTHNIPSSTLRKVPQQSVSLGNSDFEDVPENILQREKDYYEGWSSISVQNVYSSMLCSVERGFIIDYHKTCNGGSTYKGANVLTGLGSYFSGSSPSFYDDTTSRSTNEEKSIISAGLSFIKKAKNFLHHQTEALTALTSADPEASIAPTSADPEASIAPTSADPEASIDSTSADPEDNEEPIFKNGIADIFGYRQYYHILQKKSLPKTIQDGRISFSFKDMRFRDFFRFLTDGHEELFVKDSSGVNMRSSTPPLNMGWYGRRFRSDKFHFLMQSFDFGAPISEIRFCTDEEISNDYSLNYVVPLKIPGDYVCPQLSEIRVGSRGPQTKTTRRGKTKLSRTQLCFRKDYNLS